MSDYPAAGREKTAIRKIIALVDPICDAQDELKLLAEQMMDDLADDHEVHWRITEQNALEGVRSNGTEHTTTLATIIVGLRRIRKRRLSLGREIDREIRKLDALLVRAERIVEPFELCRKCKGACGFECEPRPLPDSFAGITRWQDCGACLGRGLERENAAR